MKYTALNKNWNPLPHNAELQISKTDDSIELTFTLDATTQQHIDEGEKGIISFTNVYAYTISETNKMAYCDGKYRYKNDSLPWGNFYELKESNWNSEFPKNCTVVLETIDKKKLHHYILFLSTSIIEILATDFNFSFVDTISDILDEKYPKGYLHYYIVMFTGNFRIATKDNYLIFTNLYIQMQGKKEFAELKNEITNIRKNNDLQLFLKLVNYSEIENFGMKQLNEMLQTIELYKN